MNSVSHENISFSACVDECLSGFVCRCLFLHGIKAGLLRAHIRYASARPVSQQVSRGLLDRRDVTIFAQTDFDLDGRFPAVNVHRGVPPFGKPSETNIVPAIGGVR